MQKKTKYTDGDVLREPASIDTTNYFNHKAILSYSGLSVGRIGVITGDKTICPNASKAFTISRVLF